MISGEETFGHQIRFLLGLAHSLLNDQRRGGLGGYRGE